MRGIEGHINFSPLLHLVKNVLLLLLLIFIIIIIIINIIINITSSGSGSSRSSKPLSLSIKSALLLNMHPSPQLARWKLLNEI